jgi:hypothetical protein
VTRLRSNNVFGTTTDAPLTAGATTMNAAGLANLVAVTGSDYAVVTLDPNRVDGAPEIIYVTAHTGSATSATILRAQEGTSAREHDAGTFWVHAPTAIDHRPFTPPAVQVYISGGTQSVSDATETTFSFDTEAYDTDSMHSGGAPTRITFTTAGLYLVAAGVQVADNSDYLAAFIAIRKGGSTILRYASDMGVSDGAGPRLNMAGVWKFAAAEYIELRGFHNNTGNAARNMTPVLEAVWLGEG